VRARRLLSRSAGRVIPYTGSITSKACAAAFATTARCSGDRSTTKRQPCALAPEGAHLAASRHRARVMSSTGSSVKRRIVLAVDITSQTSPVAPVIAAPPSRAPDATYRDATRGSGPRPKPTALEQDCGEPLWFAVHQVMTRVEADQHVDATKGLDTSLLLSW
jgi:hypothetical protein